MKTQIDGGRVSLLEVYEGVLHEISLLDKAEAKGTRLCARVRWAEEGEISSRFFLRQESRKGVGSWISAICRPDGSLASSISVICTSWVDFYSDRFTADQVDLSAQDFLLGCLSAKLPFEASATCEGLLTLDEVFKALEGMARDKSPGSDGVLAEFYRAFWPVLGADLVDVLNDSFPVGILPPSFPLSSRRGIASSVKTGAELAYSMLTISFARGP